MRHSQPGAPAREAHILIENKCVYLAVLINMYVSARFVAHEGGGRVAVIPAKRCLMVVRRSSEETVTCRSSGVRGSRWADRRKQRSAGLSSRAIRMAGSKCLQSGRVRYSICPNSPQTAVGATVGEARGHHPQRCASNCTLSAGTPTGGRRSLPWETTTRFGKNGSWRQITAGAIGNR